MSYFRNNTSGKDLVISQRNELTELQLRQIFEIFNSFRSNSVWNLQWGKGVSKLEILDTYLGDGILEMWYISLILKSNLQRCPLLWINLSLSVSSCLSLHPSTR